MELSYFPVQASIILPEALMEEVQKRYGIGILKCRLWSTGLNDIYLMESKELRYYLRISHAIRYKEKDYEEELDVIQQLRNEQITTCVPVLQRDQQILWSIEAPEGRRYAILWEEVKQDDSRDLCEMGKLVARIHQVSDQKKFTVTREPIMYDQLIQHPLQTIRDTEMVDPKKLESIEEAANDLWQRVLEQIPQEAPYYGFCHGDVHSGNLYFYQGKPQIFDFDCMGYGFRAYELAVYLWDEASVHDYYIESEEWNSYVKGYESIRGLAKAEKMMLPAFAAFRQLWFIAVIIDATKINNSWDGINQGFFDQQLERFQWWLNQC